MEERVRTTWPKAVRLIVAALFALSLVPAAALMGGQGALAQTAFAAGQGEGAADGGGSPNAAQGSASLALAHYEFKFYPGAYFDTYEEAEKSGSAHRTWVLQTDEDGWVDLGAAELTFETKDGATHSYFVSGDNLYYTADGEITLPLGTLTVKETKAPEGYNLSDATFVQRIKAVDGKVVREGDVDIRDGSTLFDGTVEHPKRGDLKFEKKSEADASWLAGVPFRITSKTTGESHVVVTDANGQVDTSAAFNKHTDNTNFNDTAEDGAYDPGAGVWFGAGAPDDGKGALLYDTYLIEELPCKANEGLQLVTGTAVVSKDGYTVDLGTIDDPAATIGTTATDALSGGHVAAVDEEATIIDRVDYAGLIEGGTYTLKTELMFSDDGQPVLSEGEAVAKETEFTAESTAGYVDVDLTFDATGIAGRSTTVFEELYDEGGRLIAEHRDLDDAQQTVDFAIPEISTSAVDANDRDKAVVADPEAKIVDSLLYRNVVAGADYTALGIVVDAGTGLPIVSGDFDQGRLLAFSEGLAKAMGFEIGKAGEAAGDSAEATGFAHVGLLDAFWDFIAPASAGEAAVAADAVTVSCPDLPCKPDFAALEKLLSDNADMASRMAMARADFVPENASGTIEVEFPFDASALAGRTAVVYEILVKDDSVMAAHVDINDEAQTVEIVPSSIRTTATDKTDGDHEAIASKETAIVDEVAYENLVVGKEYKLSGQLMVASTGKPLMVNDKPVTAEKTFVPNSSSGTVSLEFRFDSTALAGQELVAFESLTKDGIEVASHADINDEAQTVAIVEQPKGSWFDKTGGMAGWMTAASVMLAAGAVAAAAYGIRARKEEGGAQAK